MTRCQFETVDAVANDGCRQDGECRVEYRFAGDEIPTQTRRRYCLAHANRVRDYLEQAGLIARVVRA